jgi:hypothetical protein
MKFCSSRILPGQPYRTSVVRTSSGTCVIDLP